MFNILVAPLCFVNNRSQGETTEEVFKALKLQPAADFSHPIWKSLPAGAVNLLTRLLDKNPRTRISAADVLK